MSVMSGSTAINSRNRTNPAIPTVYCSTKLERRRMGCKKVLTYREKVNRVDIIEVSLHDEITAKRDDRHIHNAAEKVETGKENSHLPVVLPFRGAVAGITLLKFLNFIRFCCGKRGPPVPPICWIRYPH